MKILIIISVMIFALNSFAGITIPRDSEVMRTWNTNIDLERDQTEFNLLVWNVKKLSMFGIQSDLRKFSKDFDLMLVQEFSTDPILEYYWSTFKNQRIDFATSFFVVDKYQTGVANISKLKMDDLYWVRSNGREPLISSPKMSIISHYNINGKDLLIVNTHFINFVRLHVYISELQRLTDLLKSHDGPMIFAGDFNCWTNKRREALQKMAEVLGLTEVIFPEREKTLIGRLDHVFYRGIHISDAHVLIDYTSSDHWPLVMKVRD